MFRRHCLRNRFIIAVIQVKNMRQILTSLMVCGLMLLTACGGSTGPSPLAAPPSPPPPPPAAAPAPPGPTGSPFDTAEFRANYGLNNINAIPAYDDGLSGNGVIVAVIDTGIDVNHDEFVGQIHPDSRDLVGTRQIRTIQDEGGHGTFVAGIIAARRDGVGVHGVAFNSQLLVLRADDVGSCNSDDGCHFHDNDLAAGIDAAIASGARIINFSLGGDHVNQALHDAYFRAFAAGIVFVISAGNEHTANPNPFAQFAIHDGAEGSILVVGAIGPNNESNSFSNHAGNTRDYFVVAPGVDITSTFTQNTLGIGSGTSFSAPHVTGAAAVMFEMFPALTGIEVFEILLNTAIDLGAPGVDEEFGHGLIDLGAAIQPLGVLSLAVAGSITPLGSSGIDASGAFGDGFGLTGALNGVMMLDGYRRSYTIDLGERLRSRASEGFDLYGALERKRSYEALSLSPTEGSVLRLAFYDRHQRQRELADALPMAQRALTRLERPSAYFTGQLGENTSFATAYGISPITLLDQQEGGNSAARGFISSGFAPELAFTPAGAQSSMALSHILKGGTRLSFAFSYARYERQNDFLFGANSPEATAITATARASRRFGPVDLMFQLSAVNEKNAVLGTLSSGALTLGDGAGSLFTSVGASTSLPADMTLTLSFNHGYTRVSDAGVGSFVDGISNFRSMSFAAAITKDGLLAAHDRIGLAVSQPLRIESGAIGLTLPTGRDYLADEILFTSAGAALAPSGREIDLEMSYQWRGFGGTLIEANVMRQFNAGHSSFAGGRTTVLVRARRPF